MVLKSLSEGAPAPFESLCAHQITETGESLFLFCIKKLALTLVNIDKY